VSGFERHGHLEHDAERFIELEWTTPETVTQSFALDVFGGDVVAAGGFTDFENGKNVRMIEREDRARFLFEPPQSALGSSEFLWLDFERALAAVLFGVFGEQDFAHATLAEPA
jgi:hypothetical protein